VEDFRQNYNLSVPIKQYRYSELKRMTNSFRDKLGQGGYGVVYKASLPDGRQVAVKMINESKGNGEEFINEVASISRTSHVNIVSLLGFCYEKKRALIYEFMSKGSLDKFIFKSGFPDAICNLDWKTLYQIAIGIARGLEYLHQGCTSRILHLDIKPQNILLDEDFCPKKITMVSLWCIQTNPLDRPSMSKVIEMLQGPLHSVPYPPKPFLYSPQMSSLQTSHVSSSNLLEKNSIP